MLLAPVIVVAFTILSHTIVFSFVIIDTVAIRKGNKSFYWQREHNQLRFQTTWAARLRSVHTRVHMADNSKQDYNEDYYSVLEVDPTIDERKLKKLYYKLVIKYHPDNKPNASAVEKEQYNKQMMVRHGSLTLTACMSYLTLHVCITYMSYSLYLTPPRLYAAYR